MLTDGLSCEGLLTAPLGLLLFGLSAGFAAGCEGFWLDGLLPTAGFVAAGLLALGLLPEGFLSAGLISAGRLDELEEPDGLVTDELEFPDGRAADAFPEGLFAGRASLFVFVSDDFGADDACLVDDAERETDDDFEFPRDCELASG